jgi:hypothetical protein
MTSGASGVLREVVFPVPPELTVERRRALQLLAEAPNGMTDQASLADSGDCGQVFRLIADTDSD